MQTEFFTNLKAIYSKKWACSPEHATVSQYLHDVRYQLRGHDGKLSNESERRLLSTITAFLMMGQRSWGKLCLRLGNIQTLQSVKIIRNVVDLEYSLTMCMNSLTDEQPVGPCICTLHRSSIQANNLSFLRLMTQ